MAQSRQKARKTPQEERNAGICAQQPCSSEKTPFCGRETHQAPQRGVRGSMRAVLVLCQGKTPKKRQMARKQGEVCARELKKPLAHGNTGAKRMKCRKPLKKAPKSHEIGKKRSELRKTARRLRLREKGAHDIEGLCELHNSHLVPKRYEETCKTAAFCLVLHVSYAPIG